MAEAKAPFGIFSKKFIRFGTVTPFPKESFDFCARFLKRDSVLKMYDLHAGRCVLKVGVFDFIIRESKSALFI